MNAIVKTTDQTYRAEFEAIAEQLGDVYGITDGVVLDQDKAGYVIQILTSDSRWWIGDLAEDWGGTGWAAHASEDYLNEDPDRFFGTGLSVDVRDPSLVAHAIAVAIRAYVPPAPEPPRVAMDQIRLAIETDPAVLQGYRDPRHERHIEVFRAEDAAGHYLTTILFDADAEVWTIEPDEIWAASYPTLMDALRGISR